MITVSSRTTAHLTAAALAGCLAAAATLPALEDYATAMVDRASLEAADLSPRHPVLTEDLLAAHALFASRRSVSSREQLLAQINGDRDRPSLVLAGDDLNLIQVDIRVSQDPALCVEDLESVGIVIEGVSPSRLLIQALVPLEVLGELDYFPWVTEVSRPHYGIPTAGSINSQGDVLQGTSVVRFFDEDGDGFPDGTIDGTGTVVAVLSTGLFGGSVPIGSQCPPSWFDTIAPGTPINQRTELPLRPNFQFCSQVPTFGYMGGIPIYPPTRSSAVHTRSQAPGGYFPEGTAILEVAHDVAPGAAKIYGGALTSIDLELARQFLFNPPGGFNIPDVIIDNIVFTGVGRYDGSSAVSRSATTISRTRQIPYFVSAGGVTPPNPTGGVTTVGRFPAQITGFFNGNPGDDKRKVHSWNSGTFTNRDEALNIDVVEGQLLDVTLVWDDVWDDISARSTVDLDVFLVPRATLDISQAVAASTRLQNGASSNPVERLIYFIPPPPPGIEPQSFPFALVLVNKDSKRASKTLFTLTIESGTIRETKYLTHGVALNNADALRPVISVGHIDMAVSARTLGAEITPGLTPYGAVSGTYLRWYESQVFPTVVGYSSVHTLASSLANSDSTTAFTGPSAAVAHLGGFASLLRQRFPMMPATRMYDLFGDTSSLAADGEFIFPLAEDITPAATAQFHRAPIYRRTNPLNMYRALVMGDLDPFFSTSLHIPLVARADDGTIESAWRSHAPGTILQFDSPEFLMTDLGLEIKPTSDWSVGYWESPLLTVQGPDDTEPRTTLRADRLYMVEARVGSTATDPLAVPDFRLQILSGNGDETGMLDVIGLTRDAGNTPTTIGGITYQVYYRPTNQAIADLGARFVFSMINTRPVSDLDSSLILRDFTFHELPLPFEE